MHSQAIQRSLVAICVFFLGATVAEASVSVDHDPVERARSGQRIPLDARIQGEQIRVARAYFKAQSGSRYFFVPMQVQSGTNYLGVLPAPSLGSISISYFLLAATTGGAIVKTDTYVIDVENDKEALARSELRQPEEIEIDVDKYEKTRDLVDRLGKKPDPGQQVPVGSEDNVDNTNTIPGFDDFIIAAQQDPLLAMATPIAAASNSGKGLGTRGWMVVGGVAVAGGIAAATGGGGSSGGTPSAAPTGTQIGTDHVPPNGPQQAPYFLQLIPFGAATPLRVRYNGSDIGTWNGTALQDFPLSTLNGRAELIFTQDVTGGNFNIHFRTNGGQSNTGLFNATAGDYIVALPQ